MDLTPSNLQILFTGYNTAFQTGFGSLENDAMIYEHYCMVVPSNTSKEVYPFLKELPSMREWIGDRVIHGLESGDFSIKNRKFELTIGVPRDSIEDDSYGLYEPFYRDMGMSTRKHPVQLSVEVLESNPICYDGQPLFDTDHLVLDADGEETSTSNDMGGAGPAWYVMDLSRAIKPLIFQRRRDYDFRAINNLNDADVFKTDKFMFGVDARANVGAGLWQLVVRSKQTFNAANYEAARNRLQGLRGDYDRPMGLTHTHTMIPNSLEGSARKVIVNTLAAGGETNEWAGSSTLIKNPWLSAA